MAKGLCRVGALIVLCVGCSTKGFDGGDGGDGGGPDSGIGQPDQSTPPDTADASAQPDLLAKLDDAAARWRAAKPTCGGGAYTYDRDPFPSYPAGFTTTTVWIQDDVVIRRHFRSMPRGVSSLAIEWAEDASEVGAHGELGNSGVAPPRTIDQLFSECRETLSLDPAAYDLALTTDDRGIPVRCSARRKGCFDDCTVGVNLTDIRCELPQDPTDLTGSYDLTFPVDPSRVPPERPDEPSYRMFLRRLVNGIYSAVWSLDLQPTGYCRVVLEREAVRLERCTSVSIERAPDGSLSSAAIRLGASGTVQRSTAPAALQVVPASASPQRPRLPWEPIGLVFGDGDAVDWDQFRQLVTVRTDRSASVQPRLSIAPTPTAFDSWAGAFGASAAFAWDDVAATSVTFQLGAGMRDFGGLVAPASSATAAVADIGTARAEHTFDGASLGVAAWGSASISVGDPACDSTIGCAAFSLPGNCDVPGLAGLLASSAGVSKVVIRARRVTPDANHDISLGVTLLAEDGRAATRWVALPPELTDLGPSAGASRWVSDWYDAEVPLPTGDAAPRWGFVVRPGIGQQDLGLTKETCKAYPTRVLIDAIAIR